MYSKDLTCSFTLRLSEQDMQFCISIAEDYGITVSRYVRWLISDARRFNEGLESASYCEDSAE